jgi:hypothetical protein
MFKPLYPRILMGMLLVLTSCGSSKNELPQPPNAQPTRPPNAQPRVPSNVQREVSAPPKGARFTIYAGAVRGDLHVQSATRIRDTLKTSTKMPDWYVIHEADRSLIYYGYYPSLDDPRAKRDRQKIDGIVDQMGNRPFPQALMVEIATPDPDAPPEWNLANAKGFWTLQIAVYNGTPERKQAAVDTVREARKQGLEAYYLHGEAASFVCIGTWPQTAAEVTTAETPRGSDPSKPLMVVPATNDPALNRQFEEVARQRGQQLVRPQMKVIDPTLEAALQQFPRMAVNGMEMKRTVNGQEVYSHSLVFKIPRSTEEANAMEAPAPTNQPAYPTSYRPEIPRVFDPPPQQQGGRLRSIGG